MVELGHVRAILLPILLAYVCLYGCRYFLSSSSIGSDEYAVPAIPVSRVLDRALRMTDRSSTYNASALEISMLYHALLALQNPELTPYAGAGYGFELSVPNPGAVIEPFPAGRLPRADGRGRFDAWGRVKGLRWVIRYINTDPWKGGLLRLSEDEKPSRKSEDFVQAMDAAGVGSAALLLEAAGAEDWKYPMPPGSGRNAYGEAVDRLVERLFDDKATQKVFVETVFNEKGADRTLDGSRSDLPSEDSAATRQVGEVLTDTVSFEQHSEPSFEGRKRRWVLGRQCKGASDTKGDYDQQNGSGVFPGDMFIIPSLLADYAIARQNTTWLIEAVELFQAYHNPSIWLRDHDLWKDEEPVSVFDMAQQQPKQGNATMIYKEQVSKQSIKSAAYAHLSATRLRHIIRRWQPSDAALRPGFGSTANFAKWRENSLRTLTKISEVVWLSQQDAINTRFGKINTGRGFVSNGSTNTTLKHDNEQTRPEQSWEGEMPYVAMIASSLYQTSTLLKQRPESIADLLYASIAQIASDTKSTGPGVDISLESQIGILITYAAKRDCVKLSPGKEH